MIQNYSIFQYGVLSPLLNIAKKCATKLDKKIRKLLSISLPIFGDKFK